MPLPFVQDEPSPENYNGLVDNLPVGLGEQLATTFTNELSNNGVTSKILDLAHKNNLEEQQRDTPALTVEELNQKYQGLNIPWSGPQKPEVAEYIAERQRQKIYNEKKIESGPDGFISGGLRMGAGIVAHMADPTELALTVSTAGLFRLGLAARFGASAIEAAGLGGRLAMGAAEGAITQAALEPLQYKYDTEFQNDYKSADALERVIMGAGMGAGVEGGSYLFGRLMKRMRGTKAGVIAQDVALAQIESGRTVNIDPIVQAVENEVRVPEGRFAPGVRDFSGRLEYEHAPFDPTNPGGQKVYLGSKSALEDFHMLDRDTWGEAGMVSDPRLAHADASSAWNDAPGNVHEFTLSPEAKIASASQPLTLPERTLILDKVKELAAAGSVEFKNIQRAYERGNLEFNNLGEMLNVVRSFGMDENHLITALKPTLEEAGFHGVHIEVDEAGAKLNRFEFFDNALATGKNNRGEALFAEAKALAADERLNPMPTEAQRAEAIKKAMEPEPLIAPEQKAMLDQFEAEHPATPEAMDAQLEAMNQEAAAGLKMLEEQAKTDPELAQLLQAAKELDAAYAQELAVSERAMKAAMSCVVKNGV